VLCFCFVVLRLVYPILPVSLDCPLLISPSVFCNIYFLLVRELLFSKIELDSFSVQLLAATLYSGNADRNHN
jgi:hypothetical protein